MSIVNLLRVLVILFGGSVVGVGFAVLIERSRYYTRRNLLDARVAMMVLAGMNALVMLYLTACLIVRWDQPLSWPWAGALLIFLVKAYFFHLLRNLGIEQERRSLFGE